MRASIGFFVLVAACGESSVSERGPRLRAALDRAELSLIDSVAIASERGDVVSAHLLLTDPPVFSVGVMEGVDRTKVRVDIVTGEVLDVILEGGAPIEACPDAIPLVESLRIAELEVSGNAVGVVRDDDVACAQEVRVLNGTNELEVKIAPDGLALGSEPADD